MNIHSKKYFNMKKTVLITGTSSGVGFETALLMAEKGYHVFASMRNLKKANKLMQAAAEKDLTLDIIKLDVSEMQSITEAIHQIIEKEGKIDILINNAGAGFAKTLEQATLQEIDWVTDVNYTGVVRTTKAVLPYMREAKSGKIINITSVGGLVGQPFNELYCGAKFAVEGFTEALASYVSNAFNIQFSCVEPGGIDTEFMKSAIGKTTNQEGAFEQGAYAELFSRYLQGAQSRASEGVASNYQSGKEVAAVILSIAQSEKPPLRIRTSAWAENFCQLKTQADPDGRTLLSQVSSAIL